jgi:uncharacterized repeat protein (TIGR01451 family)
MQEPHSASRKIAAVLAVMALLMALLPASVSAQPPWPQDGPPDPGSGLGPEALDPSDLNNASTNKDAVVATSGGLAGGEVYPGDTITYTIVVSNPGGLKTDVSLNDPIPDGTSNASLVSWSNGTAGIDPTLGITWTGSVASDDTTAAVTFTVTADDVLAEGTVIDNEATINDGDPTTANFKVSRALTVVSPLKSSSKTAADADGDADVLVGDVLTYTIDLENTGPKDLTVHVTDTLPVLVEYGGGLACPGCTVIPEYITATGMISLTTVVSQGEQVTLTWQVTLTGPVQNEELITNTGWIDDGAGSRILRSAVITAFTPLGQSLKRVSEDSGVEAGETLTYSLKLRNDSSVMATASFTDILPAEVEYVWGSASKGWDPYEGGRIMAGTTSVAAGSSEWFTFRAKVKADTPAGASIVNPVQINDGVNPVFTVTVESLMTEADFGSSTKTAYPVNPGPGDTVLYTVVLTHPENVDVASVLVTDTLPAELDYVPGSVTATVGTPADAGNGIQWTGDVGNGTAVTITYQATVSPTLPVGRRITNTAWITGPGIAEAPVTKTAVVTTTALPNFSASYKEVNKEVVKSGGWLTYTVHISNTGIVTGTDVEVRDEIPANTNLRTSDTYGNGTIEEQGGWIIWTGPAVSPGTEVTFTLGVTVDEETLGGVVITNTAEVSESTIAGVVYLGPVTSTVQGVPDLSGSTKTVDSDTPSPGDVVTYTIVVSNSGSGDAVGTSLTDDLPDKVTFVDNSLTITPTGKAAPTHSAGVVSWSDDMARLEVVTITFQATVADNLPDGYTITNTAVISQSELADAVSKDAVLTITGVPELEAESLKLVDGVLSTIVFPGQGPMVYSLSLVNSGTEDATGVNLSDELPEEVISALPAGPFSVWSATGSVPDANYSSSAREVTWSGTVTQGNEIVITIPVTVGQSISGTEIVNRAAVHCAQLVTPTFHLGPVTATVESPLALGSVKTSTTDWALSDDEVGRGGTITYTIQVVNSGPEDTTADLYDAIPMHTSYVPGSAEVLVGGGQLVSDTAHVGWSGTVTSSDYVEVRFEVRVASILTSGTEIENVATVTDEQGWPVVLTDTVTAVSYLEASTKAGFPQDGLLQPGDVIRYDVTVENSASSSVAFALRDPIPANTEFARRLGSVGAYDQDLNAMLWTDSVPASDDLLMQFEVTVTEQVTADEIVNVAYINDDVTMAADLSSNPPLEREDTQALSSLLEASTKYLENHVVNGNASASLGTALVGPMGIVPGEVYTYVIVVVNTGNITSAGSLSDQIPDGLSSHDDYITYTWGTASITNDLVTWEGDVSPSGGVTPTVEIRFPVQVDRPLTDGLKITNTVWITDGTGVSPISKTTEVMVVSGPVLTATKTADPSTPEPGDRFAYTIVLENIGTENESGVVLTDSIPVSMTYVSGSVTGGATYDDQQDQIEWSGDAIYGQPVTITFQVDLASEGVPDVITNTVWFSGTKTPPTMVEEPVYTSPKPDLSASTKEVAPSAVYAGDNLTFTITLANVGTGPATVDLTDDIPDGTTFVSVAGATWYPISQRIGWTGVITEGTSHVITLVVNTDAGLAGGTLIANTAEFVADSTTYSRTATASIPSEEVDHFTFAAIGTPQHVNQPFTITITAEDVLSNTVTTYTGTVVLGDSTSTIAPSVSGSFDAGVWTGSVTIGAAGAGVVITATDSVSPTVIGVSEPFDVVWPYELLMPLIMKDAS